MGLKNKVLELKKHVAAIHSTSSMTLIQRKIANGLLYNAYAELLEKDEHHITIKTLCELIGYDSNDHKVIKKALVNLLSTVIEWNLVDGSHTDKQGVWNASSIIADASIKGSLCTYSYSKRMRELLHRPEMYGRLNMTVQAKFKSSYGLALYENCIRYQNIQQTPWFEFNTFRQLMGVEEGKYLIFRDFKRRVLDMAISEVNQYAPISIIAELKKIQRKVVAIKFTILPNAKKNDVQIETEPVSQALSLKYGLTKQQIANFLLKYPKEYILEKTSLIEDSVSFKEGKIDNLAKYLESALINDFQKPLASHIINEVENKKEQHRKAEQELINRKKQNLLPDYQHYLNGEAIKLLSELTVVDRTAIEIEFKAYLAKTIYLPIFAKTGFNNPIIQDELYRFLRKNHGELLNKVQTFPEFCKQYLDKNTI